MRDLGGGGSATSLLQDVKPIRQKRIEISRVLKGAFNLNLYTIHHLVNSQKKPSGDKILSLRISFKTSILALMLIST